VRPTVFLSVKIPKIEDQGTNGAQRELGHLFKKILSMLLCAS